MSPVSSANDTCSGHLRNSARQAGHLVAHNDVVCLHRLQGIDGILHAFAFNHRRAGNIEDRNVGPHSFRGHLKGTQGACAGLIKKHENRLSLESGKLLYRTLENILQRLGLTQNFLNLFAV